MIAPISYDNGVRAQVRSLGISSLTPVLPAAPRQQVQDTTRFIPSDVLPYEFAVYRPDGHLSNPPVFKDETPI